MVSIQDIQAKIVSEFQSIADWEERYKKIIDIGKKLPGLLESERDDDLLVKGCQSKVWLIASLNKNGTIHFKADSDAIIVRGLIALLLSVYSDQKPEEIISTPADFIEKIGLNANLSQTRSNGLASMVKQIKFYALAFKAQLNI